METSSKSNIMNLLSFVADKTILLSKENSVFGERIEKDGITVIPVSKISVSFAGGGTDSTDERHKKQQHPAGGGANVSHTPMSCLVIKNGEAQLIQVDSPAETGKNNFAESIIKMFKKKQ